jgi:hypothetical protein
MMVRMCVALVPSLLLYSSMGQCGIFLLMVVNVLDILALALASEIDVPISPFAWPSFLFRCISCQTIVTVNTWSCCFAFYTFNNIGRQATCDLVATRTSVQCNTLIIQWPFGA